MAFLVAVLVLACLEGTFAQTFGCANTKINDQARKMFFDSHNDARRSMAKGQEPNKCGLLSTGKNVYELRWDCDMEAKAQEWADGCPSSFQTFDPTWGQNIMTYSGSFPDPLSTAASAVNAWWQQVRTAGLTDPDNKYTSGSLFSFANMANGKATAFACAYAICGGNKLSVNCIYNKIGYMTNAIIYEKGAACTADADCTTYSDSTCKNGLCYQAPPVAVVETFTMCPGVTDQSDQARQRFVDTHNKLRTRLAKGLEPDGIAAGAFAPQAKQMTKMKYDCTIEANARTWAQGCLYQHSTSAQRPGLGENLYQISINNMPKIQTAEDSSYAWWSELKDFGVGSDNILTNAVWARGVGHYTQMAWETTTKLGCFVQNCPTFTYSVCQYGPAGNYMDQLIYTKGAPCASDADCPGAQTCSVAEALCVVP